jgi:DNA invertase Pin-like site-specific DNA recombinase
MVQGMSTTWAGIVRVSHMGKRKADDASFHAERDQVAAMEEAVAGEGGTLHVLPAELDVSGGLPIEKRPSLRDAVAGVESGRYCGIVIAYHSRLGRECEQEEAVWRRVEAAGGRIVMALDGFDTSTADGRMVRRVRSAVNAAERERHVEKFDNLARWSAHNGIWKFRVVPVGYAKDPKTRRLVPSDRADDVRWAFREHARATPIVQIAERMRMSTGGVRAMLRNRVYLGEVRVGNYVNDPANAHEALVTAEEWAAAQRIGPRPPRGDSAEPSLLAGLVRCSGCGHVMSRAGRHKTAAYRCQGRSSAGPCPAPAGITRSRIDELLTALGRQAIEDLRVRAREGHRDLDNARAASEKADRELTGYLEAVSIEDVGAEAFAAGARARRKAADVARAVLERQLALRPPVPDYGDAWEAMSGHERNVFLRGLLAAVVVRRVGRGRNVPVTERVRLVPAGAGFDLVRRHAGQPGGINPIRFDDLDRDHVIRVPGSEDGL